MLTWHCQAAWLAVLHYMPSHAAGRTTTLQPADIYSLQIVATHRSAEEVHHATTFTNKLWATTACLFPAPVMPLQLRQPCWP